MQPDFAPHAPNIKTPADWDDFLDQLIRRALENGDEQVVMTENFRLLQAQLQQMLGTGKITVPQARAMSRDLLGLFEYARHYVMRPGEPTPGAARGVHRELDIFLQEFDKQSPLAKDIACKRGCAACCYMQVTVTRDEAALLAERVRGGVAIDRARLAAQAALPDDTTEYFKAREACVFLDPSTQTCRVYADRPGSCRNYRVLFDSKACGDQVHKQVPVLASPRAEAFLSAAYQTNGIDNVGPLAKFLHEALT